MKNNVNRGYIVGQTSNTKIGHAELSKNKDCGILRMI